MSKKSTAAAEPTRVKFADDPTCIAYQWINKWQDKDKQPVLSSSGEQVKSLSRMYRGGGHDNLTLEDLNRGIADESIIGFVNGKVIVYRYSTRKREDRGEQNAF